MNHTSRNAPRPLYRAVEVPIAVDAAAPVEVLEVMPEALEVVPIDVVEDAPAVELVAEPEVMDAIPILTAADRNVPAEQESPLAATPERSVVGRIYWTVTSGMEWLCGVAALFVALAILAALPVLQFLSLGYLLEAGGRIARTGRLRDGFIGVRMMARIGGMVLGCWLCLLPVRFAADLARSAQIIDPGGKIAEVWRVGVFVMIVLTFVHIAAACARGGKLRYFFWPFNFVSVIVRLARGGYYTEARDAVWDLVVSLRLPYYFWLGFRGFVGAFVWLVLPITMLALSRGTSAGAGLVGFLGACLLTIVLMYLPFLQLRLAATNRLRGAFELGKVRADFCRAPWAFAFSFVVTLAFALPLYLLKIQVVPSEAAWVPSLVFITFIFPARLLTGWAMGRAVRRPTPRHWFFRWTGRLPLLPAAAFYVLIVFFTQYTSWNGVWSLYEQHAFLLPVPFFGM